MGACFALPFYGRSFSVLQIMQPAVKTTLQQSLCPRETSFRKSKESFGLPLESDEVTYSFAVVGVLDCFVVGLQELVMTRKILLPLIFLVFGNSCLKN